MRSSDGPVQGNSPTGEPDAGDPHVRFGGRGGVILRPYPYLGKWPGPVAAERVVVKLAAIPCG